jgi:hypothetical protein
MGSWMLTISHAESVSPTACSGTACSEGTRDKQVRVVYLSVQGIQ